MHRGSQGPFGVQRESIHLHGDLQRIFALSVPQCFHVSVISYTVCLEVLYRFF